MQSVIIKEPHEEAEEDLKQRIVQFERPLRDYPGNIQK
jgi:hypothetical protein